MLRAILAFMALHPAFIGRPLYPTQTSCSGRRWAAFILLAITLSACAGRVNHQPLVRADYEKTDFQALMPERWWGDEAPPGINERLRRMDLIGAKSGEGPPQSPQAKLTFNMLVLSGGSANGAFGAGLLQGWSQSGTRPTFQSVTGVSTGALIAPFAFLGSAYDDKLIEAYSTVDRKDIYRSRGFAGLLFGSSMADTKPLRDLIKAYITPDVVAAIAREYRKGRSLAIITTELDALRPVVWQIGAIANNRGEAAVPLIRKIILASAAIPGFFPPVTFHWQENGRTFTELHVDGAVSRQVFSYPAQLHVAEISNRLKHKIKLKIFVIQNSNNSEAYKPASTKTGEIMKRALSGLLQNQLIGDVERTYYLAKRDGAEFHMVAIPENFQADKANEFQRTYMQKLIKLGKTIGKTGSFWQDKPPSER